jgi:PTS system mannitol-specific IIC component
MVMPNIGAFIAWGLITAMFIPTGWIPNESFATIVDPMLKYLLPLLIGYTAGKNVYGGERAIRGGVTGAILTFGVIQGATIPMFLGAMIVAPIGGVVIKYFDKLIEGKVKAGFEMLVDNFSVGIIGGGLALLVFNYVQPLVTSLTDLLGSAVGYLVDNGMLPLASIIVEPAKVLFLNNAINHGVFTPLGTQAVAETGKSILFMVESNPGPGLGLLLAYILLSKGMTKSSALGASIIHFFGGIHEIYFPFVLMNPILIVPMIFGGMSGVFTLSLFNGGLAGPASPGSIIAEMLMTPKDSYFANIAGITVAAVVTFVLSALCLKFFVKLDDDDSQLIEATAQSAANKGAPTKSPIVVSEVDKVVFACDAGMGSSAMGASRLKRKLKDAGLTGVDVAHYSVGAVPAGTKVIVVHTQLAKRVKDQFPDAHIFEITDFLNAPEYDEVVKLLKG